MNTHITSTWIGVAVTFLCFSNILPSNCQNMELLSRIKHSSAIGKNYTALKKLTYGDKCNVELEGIGENAMNRLLPVSVALSMGDDLELTESLIVEIVDSLAPVEVLIEKVALSSEGGLCNTTKYLYCDKSVGECRCGKSVKPKGYSYTIGEDKNECKFDLGSGCLPEKVELLGLRCKEGTKCVTSVRNAKCDTENMIMETVMNPTLTRSTAFRKGYVCYCDQAEDEQTSGPIDILSSDK